MENLTTQYLKTGTFTTTDKKTPRLVFPDSQFEDLSFKISQATLNNPEWVLDSFAELYFLLEKDKQKLLTGIAKFLKTEQFDADCQIAFSIICQNVIDNLASAVESDKIS